MPLLTITDLNTHLYPEVRDEITRNNDDLVEKAITNGEGEAKSYLNRYDTAQMWVTPWKNKPCAEWLKSLVKDIVCWHLIKLANPNINLELFRTAYEDAVKYLEKVMKGQVDPDWPLKQDDPATPIDEAGHISYSSNPKRSNHY